MKKILFNIILFLIIFVYTSHGQIPVQKNKINPVILKNFWSAQWITCPDVSLKDYGVFHFRKTFFLDDEPDEFIVHVSADNRYILYVNGKYITYGPSRGDLQHWRFETIDISKDLKKGKNVIAAVVWNFGEHIPNSQVTLSTAFILCGNGEYESILNTNKSWKVIQNHAYQPISGFGDLLKSYYVVGPGDRVEGSKYPWGWELESYDDATWINPRVLPHGQPRGKGTNGYWMLVPREIDFMYMGEEAFKSVRKEEGIDIDIEALSGSSDVVVEKNKKISLLLDQGFLTKSFPELILSGGKGAEIKLSYAEALFDVNGIKGNRDQVEGKTLLGNYDVFIPDGNSKRMFMPLWFRTYRYIQVDIETAEEPLIIHQLLSKPTGFPLKQNSSFQSDHPQLKDVWEVGYRTAQLCAGEIYYDCPYYEQMQYVGDTRIQALISLYVDGNDKLMRKAISAFENSRRPNGLTQSRYPSSSQQIIPPYSLFWIAMIHDYWMYRDDPEFVKSLLPGINSVLYWFEEHLDKNDMLGSLEWWNFVDWAIEWPWDPEIGVGGVPFGVHDGNSSNISLQYAYTLDMAVELFNNFGNEMTGKKYKDQSKILKKATYNLCWDSDKGLLADSPQKKYFSQHANIFGILTDAIPMEMQAGVMKRILEDNSLIQCTMYFKFYLFQAMKKTGMADLYVENLDQWFEMLKNGLTTFAEKPDPARSDCHAWSASPNYDLLATVCGIRPGSPGFRTVEISPSLGDLKEVSGKLFLPAYDDYIEVELKRIGNGIKGYVSIPGNMQGKFKWKNQEIVLSGGEQEIDF